MSQLTIRDGEEQDIELKGEKDEVEEPEAHTSVDFIFQSPTY
jgi:hypothetical protein